MKNEKMNSNNNEVMQEEKMDQVSGGLFGFDEEEPLAHKRSFKNT